MSRFLRSFQSARKFLQSYLSMSRDYLAQNRPTIFWILVLSVLGAATQGGLIATVGYAVDYLQAPKPTGIEVADRFAGETWIIVTAICLLVCILGVSGSWATYQSRVRSRGLSRRVTISLVSRCLSLLATSHSAGHLQLPGGSSGIRRLLVRDSKQLGKAIDILLRAVEALLRILMALTILTIINWKLTASVPLLLLLTIPLFYRVHTGVKRDAEEFFDERSKSLAPVMRELTNSMCAQNVIRGERSARHVATSFEQHPEVALYFTSFVQMILGRDRVKFATSSFSSLALALALLLGATLVSQGVLTWGETFAYLMAFWVLMGSLRQMQSLVARLAFFYSSLLRMIEFLRWSTVPAPEAAPATRATRLELNVTPRLPGSLERGVVHRGEAVCFISAAPLERSSMGQILDPIRLCGEKEATRRANYGDVCFLGSFNQLPVELPVRQLIESPSSDGADFQAHAQRIGVADEINALESGIDTVLTGEVWGNLSEQLKLVILCEVAARDERQVMLIDTRWVSPLSSEQRETLLARFDDKFLLQVTSRLPSATEHLKWIAVHDQPNLIGFGNVAWGLSIADSIDFTNQSQWGNESDDDELELLE